MKKLLALLIVVLLLAGPLAGIFFVSSPYLIMTPGFVLPIDQLINIPALPEDQQLKRGHFYLTSVSIQDATFAQWIISLFDPTAESIPRDRFMPKGISPEDIGRLELQQMEESKTVAKIVALRKAGYPVSISGSGARVEAILPQSLALEKLEIGDIIVAMDGQDIHTSPELVSQVSRKRIGETVDLIIMRNSSRVEASVETISSPSEPGRAAIGVLIVTYLFDYNLPLDIEINTKNIGGPSGGLMLSLGIYNALLPQDITQGYRIAGTGTMGPDGSVGPVDGVTQKAIGAEQAGAQYFLSPAENYEAVKRASKKMLVISVNDFDGALAFLSQLAEAREVTGLTYYRLPQPNPTSLVFR